MSEKKGTERYYEQHPELRREIDIEKERTFGSKLFPEGGQWTPEMRRRAEAYQALRYGEEPHGREVLGGEGQRLSAEESAALEHALEEREFQVQKNYLRGHPAQVVDVIGTNAKTVILERPMHAIVQDRQTKKKVDSYDTMGRLRRTFPEDEMRCIARAPPDTCEVVKQAFACSNDMSVTQAAALLSEDRDNVQGCVDRARAEGIIEAANEEILGEPKYVMPRDKSKMMYGMP